MELLQLLFQYFREVTKTLSLSWPEFIAISSIIAAINDVAVVRVLFLYRGQTNVFTLKKDETNLIPLCYILMTEKVCLFVCLFEFYKFNSMRFHLVADSPVWQSRSLFLPSVQFVLLDFPPPTRNKVTLEVFLQSALTWRYVYKHIFS